VHPAPQPRSLLLAYLLCLTLGWLGAHRFYLRRWVSGFLYAISFGLYFIGWAVDLFLLPFLVRSTNQRLAEAPHPAEGAWAHVEEVHLPPAPFRPVEFALRLVWFFVVPFCFTITALMMEQWELIAILVVTLVGSALVGNATLLLKRHPMLEKAPLLGQSLGFLQRVDDMYRDRKPFPFLYYVFYPITAPLVLIWSTAARKEFVLFAKLIGGMMVLAGVPLIASYRKTFPPHLGFQEAFVVLFLLAFIVLFLMVTAILPTVTTALSLYADRRPGQTRVLVLVALMSILPAGIAYYTSVRPPLPFVSSEILSYRLAKESCRKELKDALEMFLAHWQRKEQGTSVAGGRVTPDGEDVELTEKLRRQLGGLVVGDEVEAFNVLAWGDPVRSQRWLAVGLNLSSNRKADPLLLVVAAPDGTVYTKWDTLPVVVSKQLESLTSRFALGFHPRSQVLLDDTSNPGRHFSGPERENKD
jgi:TM2 domain-containing membrane protein YozV